MKITIKIKKIVTKQDCKMKKKWKEKIGEWKISRSREIAITLLVWDPQHVDSFLKGATAFSDRMGPVL